MQWLRILRNGPALSGLFLLLAACSASKGTGPGNGPQGEVVVAAGDIVCGTNTGPSFACHHVATAELVRAIAPQAVLVLGDAQYETGALEDFERFYEPTWGAFKAITYPAPGNHEYSTAGAAGYFDYFNGVGVESGRAGHRGQGYYDFTVGAWHVIALNSNCDAITGGCGEGSPQERWLRAALEASDARCTVAFWHHPLFSSGGINEARVAPLWKALQEHDADLVLSAHHHMYQRFAPLTWDGHVDADHGIRSFVVGTGGKNVYGTNRTETGLEAIDGRSFGVLRLVLRERGFDWEFRALPGSEFTDSGSAQCH